MKLIPILVGSALIVLSACDTSEKKTSEKEKNQEMNMTSEDNMQEDEDMMEATEGGMEKNGIKIYEAPSEVEFPDAKLELKDPIGEIIKAQPTTFDFMVLDYQLKGQTAGEKPKMLANSDKGQHIHFILNNAPYQAKYEPSFDADFMEGNNVVLAFLSKSYHESVKTETAYYFENFYVGEGESDFDKSAQHLFYSRPKGEYTKDKAKKLLFDFYLINTTLGENGNKVKLTIDGTDFMINEWKAYFVEGLNVGEHTFRIQLMDKDGNMIEGPFNDSGDRKITITES